MATEEVQTGDAALRERLQELATGLGVQKPGLRSQLGAELEALWGITAVDSEQAVCAKVTRQLTALIEATTPPERVQPATFKKSLLVYFNITNPPDLKSRIAVTRQEAFREAYKDNASKATQGRHVAYALPQMEQLLTAQLQEAPHRTPELGPVPRRPSSKRALLAVAGAVAVAVAVLATLYATHGSKHQAQATTDPSASARSTVKAASALLDASSATAPVRAVSVAEHESSQDGMSWAWASAKQLPVAGLNSTYNMPDSTAYTNWYTSRGGTPVDSRTDQIVLVGNSQHTTTILNAEASKSCKSPLSGTLVRNPSAGQGDNTGLLFNLDATVSIAAEQKDTSTVPDYFGRHTYSLARGERATFMVKTKTSRYYCTYVIKLTVLDGTKKVTEQITDNGKPFEVTATIAKDHLPQFNKYRAVYLGGVESPTGDDKFKQVNPKTCTYLTLTKC